MPSAEIISFALRQRVPSPDKGQQIEHHLEMVSEHKRELIMIGIKARTLQEEIDALIKNYNEVMTKCNLHQADADRLMAEEASG